jgi:hypothetical protein
MDKGDVVGAEAFSGLLLMCPSVVIWCGWRSHYRPKVNSTEDGQLFYIA